MNKMHGYSQTRLYHVWAQMIRRCENPNDKGYNYYGGRGITVCPEWHDFMVFREWALNTGYDENAPRGQCTIDRIDFNGNYEPSNCRWVSISEQLKNRRPQEHKLSKREIKRLEREREEQEFRESVYTYFFGPRDTWRRCRH